MLQDQKMTETPGRQNGALPSARETAARGHQGEQTPAITPPPLVMPGPPEEAATEIAEEGVEGAPADARAGPGSLLLTLAALLVLLALAAFLVSWLVDWAAGLLLFAVGCLGLLLNPLVITTLLRARDRQDVAVRHTGTRTPIRH